jgi:hypothetical protein
LSGIWLAVTLLCLPIPSNADEIRLAKQGNVYYAPVTLNDTLRLHFVIDSGASLVYISNSVFEKLRASGSIQNSDILQEGYSTIANGERIRIRYINIRKLKIGNTVLTNVKGAVGGEGHTLLLGQSALKKLEPWHIDTKQKVLRFGKKTKIKKGYISPSEKINRGEVLSFINYYISLHNHGIPARTAALYASQVDYLHYGVIPRKQVLISKEHLMDKWQQIQLSLLKLIKIREDTSHPNRTSVVFSLFFKRYSDIEQQGETGQMEVKWILEKKNRSIRIVSQKQKILSRNTY